MPASSPGSQGRVAQQIQVRARLQPVCGARGGRSAVPGGARRAASLVCAKWTPSTSLPAARLRPPLLCRRWCGACPTHALQPHMSFTHRCGACSRAARRACCLAAAPLSAYLVWVGQLRGRQATVPAGGESVLRACGNPFDAAHGRPRPGGGMPRRAVTVRARARSSRVRAAPDCRLAQHRRLNLRTPGSPIGDGSYRLALCTKRQMRIEPEGNSEK